MPAGKPEHRFVAAALGGQAVGLAVVRGGSLHGPSGRQQDGSRDPEGALVRAQLFGVPTAVVGVLMNVDDRLRVIGAIGSPGGDRRE